MAASACRTAIPLDRAPTVARAVRRIARIAAPSSMGTAVRMRQSPESAWCARLYRKSLTIGRRRVLLAWSGRALAAASSAPRILSQYEFDLVARDADIPQLAVGVCQRAPLPRELGPGPPGAHPDAAIHHSPQRFERTPNREEDLRYNRAHRTDSATVSFEQQSPMLDGAAIRAICLTALVTVGILSSGMAVRQADVPPCPLASQPSTVQPKCNMHNRICCGTDSFACVRRSAWWSRQKPARRPQPALEHDPEKGYRFSEKRALG